MDCNARMEKHWEAIVLYIMGLLVLVGFDIRKGSDLRQFSDDLTLDGILREVTLRQLEEIAVKGRDADAPFYSYRPVKGWIGLPGQRALRSRWTTPASPLRGEKQVQRNPVLAEVRPMHGSNSSLPIRWPVWTRLIPIDTS